nr:MAG TPA: hypothetical protein [Caudoviricetes sp.]
MPQSYLRQAAAKVRFPIMLPHRLFIRCFREFPRITGCCFIPGSAYIFNHKIKYLVYLPIMVVNHSWEYYIFSTPTRYGGNQPFAI